MLVYNSPELLDLLASEEPKPVNNEFTEQPIESTPVKNIRKRFIQQGGLGSRQPVDGYYSQHDIRKYQCVHCKKMFEWSADLDFTDFGEVIDNLCSDCRKVLRSMRTNHPEIK